MRLLSLPAFGVHEGDDFLSHPTLPKVSAEKIASALKKPLGLFMPPDFHEGESIDIGFLMNKDLYLKYTQEPAKMQKNAYYCDIADVL